jgi:FtsP/CotA-like multicopper oxidase with cupredoxin domain
MVRFNGMHSVGTRWLAAAVGLLGLMLPQAALAQAAPAKGVLDCLPLGLPLPKIPEIATKKGSGVLRGTMLLANERQRIAFRQPTGVGNGSGKPGLYFVCEEQTVRVFRGLNAQPAMPVVPQNRIGDPIPGPTLRARLGDIVQLTFINNINTGQFPYSIDVAENDKTGGCDTSSAGYPTPRAGGGKGGDVFPDCFHGSSTGNIHFHGTHTNPNSTGDNVFLEVRPSPRVPDKQGAPGDTVPTVTANSVKTQFDAFFSACYAKLKGNLLAEWPMTWSDAPLGPWNIGTTAQPNPSTWTGQQALLLQAYDKERVESQKLWPQDLRQIQLENIWPQYYIGAFPYCYQIPEKDPAQPTTSGPLKMGQSPGTHWYHAHKHGSTAINVANGMTGVFIIEGATYDDELNKWYGDGWTQRQPVIVLNQLGVSPNLLRSGTGNTDKGPDFSVNGRLQPVIDMKPGEVQLWRIANTAGRSGAFFLGPPPGFKWRRIAQDGVQLANENYLSSEDKSFLMAPGNRVDLLVQAPRLPAIYPVVVQHDIDPSDLKSAYPVTLMSVRIKAGDQRVTGNPSQFITKAPPQPAFLGDITEAEVQGTRQIDFATLGNSFNNNGQITRYGQHTINGKKFDGLGNPEKVLLNTVEEWTITNASSEISHPFHIHVNPFQITEVFNPNATITVEGKTIPQYVTYPDNLKPGQCYLDPNDKSKWKPCTPPSPSPMPRVWWDVFPIPSGLPATNEKGDKILGPPGPDGERSQIIVAGYFKMRSRFVDYPGYYVLHCHILGHEDRGMMTTVEVTLLKDKPAAPPPFTHH